LNILLADVLMLYCKQRTFTSTCLALISAIII
jgi:hypothetical protein